MSLTPVRSRLLLLTCSITTVVLSVSGATAQPWPVDQDSLAAHSLRTLDLPVFEWNGKPDPMLPRLGIYITELTADSLESLAPAGLTQRRGFSIWHVMPHWSADEAGVLTGDVVLELDGAPIGDSLFQGEEFLNARIRAKRVGEVARLTVLRDRMVRTLDVPLRSGLYVPTPFRQLDRLGPVDQGSWLQRTLATIGLTDRSSAIARQLRIVADQDFNTVPFSESPNPWRLNLVTYLHHYPMRTGAVARTTTAALWEGASNTGSVIGALRAAARSIDLGTGTGAGTTTNGGPGSNGAARSGLEHQRQDIGRARSTFEPATLMRLDDLRKHLERVQASIDRAYLPVRGSLDSMRSRLYDLLDPSSVWEVSLDSIPDPVARRAARNGMEQRLAAQFRNATKVDFAQLLDGAELLAGLADTSWLRAFTRSFSNPAANAVRLRGIEGEIVGLVETTMGRILIGGTGPNRYSGDIRCVIDLGGNDVYEMPPVTAGSFRFVADLEGNDLYASETSGQGSGVCAVDLLVDVSGNDVYRGNGFSQGAGMLGIGILSDMSGDDIYSSHWCSQGAAFLGIGLILESGGSDSYLSDVYSQGFGYIGGIGAILESSGNDMYRAGWKLPDARYPGRAHLSMSQGFGYGMRPWTIGVGSDGGLGVLADKSGNDVYDSDYFSQGGSYWYSLGILHDEGGFDRYSAGQYSQGSGIHLSFGALLDDAGDDQYDAYAGLEQGNAHDWSAGCLEDWQGNDTYRGSSSSQGSALTVAFSWLLDSHGNDQYYALLSDTTHSQGGGNANRVRGSGSIGLLLDLGQGADGYTEPRVVPGVAVPKGNGIVYDDGGPAK